ncbi:MAG: hypothetical protein J2P37_13325 [Ktedonobacteraceae bacterium]|nr:hypothetical protein [Ktedonobacteraceae bacterium]MBO0792813.1 hypothetical protein [Ktedonobacteraceae bacterium]
MLYRRYRKAGQLFLLVGLALAQMVLTTAAVHAQPRASSLRHDQFVNTTPLDATIYLATSTLRPMFQKQLDQQIPGAFNKVLNNLVGKMPEKNRDWAFQMATTLLQPSAVLTQFTPQQNGLLTTVRLKMYANDPKPIDTSMLIVFSRLDSATVQVSAQRVNASPALMSGNLTTFHIPVGQLTSVKTTPSCGDSALALGMKIGVSLNQQSQVQPRSQAENLAAFVEMPSSSLEALGSSIGTMQISKHLSATNIQVGVEDNNLVVTADIMFDTSIKLGSAKTTMEPQARNGNLAVHVLKTDVTVFQFFTFPNNAYNQQVEQSLNARLSKAFAGKFYVTDAGIGPNAHLPCAADDSLILQGSTKIG